jgi:hypothetical protein
MDIQLKADDPQWKQLADVINAFIRTEVLTAACQLGLFDYLAAIESAAEAEIAKHFDLDLQAARILLMGCKQAGLVSEPARSRFAVTPVSARFLTARSAESMLKFVGFVRNVQQKACHTLLESLQQKEPVGLRELGALPGQTLYDINSSLGRAELDFHAAMSEYSRIVALPPMPELTQHRHVLDVGGGEGLVADRLCGEHTHLACTVSELPSMSARITEKVVKGEISDRVWAVGGDVFRDPWPTGIDAIVFSHFVEIFDPEAIQFLYRRAFEHLPAGGRVFIWTLTAPTEGEISLQAVKSSVYFLTTASGRGMTYAPEDHRYWLEAAGLTVERIDTYESTSHSLIVAVKRSASTGIADGAESTGG